MSINPNEYFTASKIAKLYGVSASEVRKALKSIKAKPVITKGGCSYYTRETCEKVKKLLKK
ncbi:MAG: hypothetical protein IGBAC_0515 [Ignavibacteriae bacterium]|nr:MAG: hypothetical protein IGBAC_0515 [Ignavibacteriota bacterium]